MKYAEMKEIVESIPGLGWSTYHQSSWLWVYFKPYRYAHPNANIIFGLSPPRHKKPRDALRSMAFSFRRQAPHFAKDGDVPLAMSCLAYAAQIDAMLGRSP